jgi:hypothetical protein
MVERTKKEGTALNLRVMKMSFLMKIWMIISAPAKADAMF